MKAFEVRVILVGIIIGCTFFIGCNDGKVNGESNYDLKCENNVVSNLKVDVKAADINIKEGDRFEVIGSNISKDDYSVGINGELLEVKSNVEGELTIGDFSDDKVTIMIPKEHKFKNIDIVLSSKPFNSEAKLISEKGSFNLGGSIKLSDFEINNCDIKCDSGEVSIINNIKGSNSIDGSYGNIDLTLANDENEYDFKLKSAGSISINEKASSYEYHTSSNKENVVKVNSTMGKVKIKAKN